MQTQGRRNMKVRGTFFPKKVESSRALNANAARKMPCTEREKKRWENQTLFVASHDSFACVCCEAAYEKWCDEISKKAAETPPYLASVVPASLPAPPQCTALSAVATELIRWQPLIHRTRTHTNTHQTHTHARCHSHCAHQLCGSVPRGSSWGCASTRLVAEGWYGGSYLIYRQCLMFMLG